MLDMGSLTRANVEALEYINFGAAGCRERYYRCKFSSELKGSAKVDFFVKRLDMEYFRALSWIQHYYYGGTVSWDWFYPFHYAPMVSDLSKLNVSITDKELWPDHQRGGPLTPLTQLSLLMPRNSAKGVIPPPYFEAIFGDNSSVRQYYPDSFAMDLNGKLWNWEAIALMPHVDVDRLQKVLEAQSGALSPEWQRRNELGHHKLFIQEKHERFKRAVTPQWGCPVVEEQNVGDSEGALWMLSIEIPNALDVCSTARKPIDDVHLLQHSQVKPLQGVCMLLQEFLERVHCPSGELFHHTSHPLNLIHSLHWNRIC